MLQLADEETYDTVVLASTSTTESQSHRALHPRINYWARFHKSALGADMGGARTEDSESRFLRYVQGLASVIGHADRVGPLHAYCLGLMVSRGRKSVEPMAAHIAPHQTSAQHQSMLHFVGNAGWSDEQVLAKVREMVLPQIEPHGPIEAWIVDDTGFPKKGETFGWGFSPILRTGR